MADRAVSSFLEAQARERERLSKILHDEVAGGLTAAGLALDLLSLDLPPEFQPRIAEVQRLIEQSFDTVRDLSREVHPDPAVRFRLSPALEMLGQRFSKRFGGHFNLILDWNPEQAEPPPAVCRACYAVAEAALDNILRHAKAERAGLEYRPSGPGPLLFVYDNGVGFARDRVLPKTGLAIMEYHIQVAGLELLVRSSKGSGTKVQVAECGDRREPPDRVREN